MLFNIQNSAYFVKPHFFFTAEAPHSMRKSRFHSGNVSVNAKASLSWKLFSFHGGGFAFNTEGSLLWKLFRYNGGRVSVNAKASLSFLYYVKGKNRFNYTQLSSIISPMRPITTFFTGTLCEACPAAFFAK